MIHKLSFISFIQSLRRFFVHFLILIILEKEVFFRFILKAMLNNIVDK
ncbi:hypothetical protein HMPREF3213_00006 [Heyndrickxia coagulans]|uniref:Uncharacterized protein n=1 Tax=Heyndrickxia coagulans TaxID=1398 RepID=A0A133L3F3_HEYCO|nr:hypothetical protein HMPREF3213_00006 [Heyndrickxia coagulans]